MPPAEPGTTRGRRVRPSSDTFRNRDMAALDCNRPGTPVRADALDADPVEPARELVLDRRAQPLSRPVGLDPEKDANQEDWRAGRPGLRTRGRRVRDRKGRLIAGVSRKHLRKRPVEASGRPQTASAESWGQTVPLW